MDQIEFSNATRPAAVAGTFYPRDSDTLKKMVSAMLAEADKTPPVGQADSGPIRTIIAPHAGYIYSGPIAASAYRYIKQAAADINTVILLGPGHRVAVHGCACPSASWFETPLGKIPIAQKQLQQLLDLKLVHINDQAHKDEHCLEVHLPFLQFLSADFKLLPLVVGGASPQSIADVINHVQDDKSLVIVSTDLSHFLDYEHANQRDIQTSIAIEKLDYPAIGPEDACGCVPLSGLLLHAQQQRLKISTVDRRNSGDTAGDKDRVVGYGAYIVS